MKAKMEKVAWKQDYEVGIESIDENHKKFVELLNHFVDVTSSEPCITGHSEIFYSLIHYAEHYLIQEEILLKDAGSQDLTRHKEYHTRFFNKIKEFQEKYASQDSGVCSDMYSFLREWFQEHIIQYDKKVAELLKEKGIS